MQEEFKEKSKDAPFSLSPHPVGAMEKRNVLGNHR